VIRLRFIALFFAFAVGFVAFEPANGAVTPAPDNAAVLTQLQPNQRQNVVVTSRSGTITATAGAAPVSASSAYVPTSTVAKPADHPTPAPMVTHDAVWLFNHRFDSPPPNPDGSLNIPGAAVRSQVSSPFDTRTGAFHGVRTVNGYSAVRTVVSIPCGSSRFAQGPGYNVVTGKKGKVDLETGYVYIGGWGAGPNGTPVDAGLQKSSSQAVNDSYTFYFKYASNKPITSSQRFACGGPDVTLEMYPATNSLLIFSATGAIAGKVQTLTIAQRTQPQDGWSPTGGSRTDGIILKRIVAIAQPDLWNTDTAAGESRFSNGSYFGIPSPKNPKPDIIFTRCDIGRVQPPANTPTYKPWTQADTWTPHQPGIYVDWPPPSVFHATAGVCDGAGIYLRP